MVITHWIQIITFVRFIQLCKYLTFVHCNECMRIFDVCSERVYLWSSVFVGLSGFCLLILQKLPFMITGEKNRHFIEITTECVFHCLVFCLFFFLVSFFLLMCISKSYKLPLKCVWMCVSSVYFVCLHCVKIVVFRVWFYIKVDIFALISIVISYKVFDFIFFVIFLYLFFLSIDMNVFITNYFQQQLKPFFVAHFEFSILSSTFL